MRSRLPGRRRWILALTATLVLVGLPAAPSAAQLPADRKGIQFGDPIDANCNRLVSGQAIQALANAGVQWVRLNFIYAAPGFGRTCDPTQAYNGLVADLRAAGFTIVGLLSNQLLYSYQTNPLIPPNSPGVWQPAWSTATFRSDFAAGVTDVVTRYRGQIDHWEVWNEPNGSPNGNGADLNGPWRIEVCSNLSTYPNCVDGDVQRKADACAYAQLLSVAATAIHNADPGSVVIGGGLLGTPGDIRRYLQAMLACPAGYAADAIGMHVYSPAGTNVTLYLGELYQTMVNKQIYITEIGWHHTGGSNTEQTQCQHLADAYAAMHSRVAAAIWFSFVDSPAGPYGLFTVDANGNYVGRPALFAFETGECANGGAYDPGGQTLTWRPVPGANGYDVSLTKASDGTVVSKWSSGASLALSSLATPLQPQQTYRWKVTALKGTAKMVVSPTWQFVSPPRPPTPSGASATPSGTGVITVRWVDNATNETGFQVSDGTFITNVPANTTTLISGGLAPGTTKCFTIRAVNASGPSGWTPSVCATTQSAAPAAPTGQTATPTGPNTIKINWIDNAANETAYEINNGTTSKTVAANTTVYTWGGLAAGTYMCFRVRAVGAAGASAWTPYACATTLTPPAAPSLYNVVATTQNAIAVVWFDNSNNESGFEVTNGTTTVTVPAGTATYTWGGLAPNTYMCFRVRAVNAAGVSAWTNWGCATTPTAIPAAPTGIKATLTGPDTIVVSWVDNSTNEGWFEVYNGIHSSFTAPNVTSVTVSNLSVGTTRCFKVRAGNGAGSSAWTPTVCA